MKFDFKNRVSGGSVNPASVSIREKAATFGGSQFAVKSYPEIHIIGANIRAADIIDQNKRFFVSALYIK